MLERGGRVVGNSTLLYPSLYPRSLFIAESERSGELHRVVRKPWRHETAFDNFQNLSRPRLYICVRRKRKRSTSVGLMTRNAFGLNDRGDILSKCQTVFHCWRYLNNLRCSSAAGTQHHHNHKPDGHKLYDHVPYAHVPYSHVPYAHKPHSPESAYP